MNHSTWSKITKLTKFNISLIRCITRKVVDPHIIHGSKSTKTHSPKQSIESSCAKRHFVDFFLSISGVDLSCDNDNPIVSQTVKITEWIDFKGKVSNKSFIYFIIRESKLSSIGSFCVKWMKWWDWEIVSTLWWHEIKYMNHISRFTAVFKSVINYLLDRYQRRMCLFATAKYPTKFFKMLKHQ